jgi:hypothetical protein
MVLYRNTKTTKPRMERNRQTLNIEIEEAPQRPQFLDRSARERRKFVTKVERLVRSSDEYKGYIKYLKEHFDMAHCEVLPGIVNGNGKKYSIEIHHEPFQLSWITDTVIRKRQELDENLSPFYIADEIMDLHYRGWVGLIPLCATAHELVHSDRIAIPLQFIYHRYDLFAKEYDAWISDYVKDIIRLKAELSVNCSKIQSDVLLEPTVTYVNVEGFDYPQVPDEWKDALARARQIDAGQISEQEPPLPESEMKGGILPNNA